MGIIQFPSAVTCHFCHFDLKSDKCYPYDLIKEKCSTCHFCHFCQPFGSVSENENEIAETISGSTSLTKVTKVTSRVLSIKDNNRLSHVTFLS